jgi:hypothetical protein
VRPAVLYSALPTSSCLMQGLSIIIIRHHLDGGGLLWFLPSSTSCRRKITQTFFSEDRKLVSFILMTGGYVCLQNTSTRSCCLALITCTQWKRRCSWIIKRNILRMRKKLVSWLSQFLYHKR